MEKIAKNLYPDNSKTQRLFLLIFLFSIISTGITNALALKSDLSGGLICSEKVDPNHGEKKAYNSNPKIIIEKIWDQAPHNAFTDLIRFNSRFYCVFRESIAHVPQTRDADGKIRILSSKDGNKWEAFALLEKEGFDLRDPSLTITPDGRLMVVMGGSVYNNGKLSGRYSQVSFLNASTHKFSDPVPVKYDNATYASMDNPDMMWLWRVIWHKNEAFGVIYEEFNKKGERLLINKSSLVSSRDGINYSLIKSFEIDGKPDETTLRFMPDGELLLLVRMESPEPKQKGLLGRSVYPFKEWKWVDTGFKIGGPNFIRTPAGELIIAARTYTKAGMYTTLFSTDSDGHFIHLADLPSGGDTSYPGMVIFKKRLFVSYYSSHEGKASIYMAQMPMKEITGLMRAKGASIFK